MAAIDNAVALQMSEGLQLDFKRKSDPRCPILNRDDKKYLGQALSGFANSMGGVLIFGVDARKNADGIDCANAVAPFKEPAKFADEVGRLIPQYVMPRLEGFEVEVVYTADNSGCVAIRVERSERRPHMSMAPDDRRYYRRSGDSFFVMEHFEVEDALKRSTVPSLSVSHRFVEQGSVSGRKQYRLILSIRNDSHVTARFPYLAIEYLSHGRLEKYGLDGNGRHGLPRTSDGKTTWFAGGADDVIHPGVEWDITAIGVERSRPDDDVETLNGIDLDKFKLEVQFRVGCENSRASRGAIILHGTQLF